MAIIRVKGYDIEQKVIKSGYSRMAVLFANQIIENLGKLGVIRDNVEVVLDVMGNKNVPASVSWYFQGHFLHMSYARTNRFIDNLYVINKVLEFEVKEVLSGEKDLAQFIFDFSEEKSEKQVKETRSEARAVLGVDEKELDLAVITKKYRELARKLHPDVAGGDLVKFQEVSVAYNTLKRELE